MTNLNITPPCYCGWNYWLSDYSVELAPGETTQVTLYVEDLINHSGGSYWEVWVNATSQADPSKYDVIITNTTIIIEEWIPVTPSPGSVDIFHYEENQHHYINVSIWLPTPCYQIEWGNVTRIGNNFYVNAEMWEWSGVCIQVITIKSHTYDLGVLEAGNYTFVFSVWNQTITWINFSINVDWNPWDDPDSEGGECVTTGELQEAIHCWLNDLPAPETNAEITTERLQEVIHLWLSC